MSTLVEVEKPTKPFDDLHNVVVLPSSKKCGGRVWQFLHDVTILRRQRALFKGIINNNGCNLVIVHFLNNAVLYSSIWKDYDIRVFVHCHGIDVTWETTGKRRKWRKLIWGDYLNEIRRLPENVRFVANSEYTSTQLTSIGIDPARIHINHQGVPVPDEIRASRVSADGRVQILYLGRLMDAKGPDLTIKAFDIACGQGMAAELVMAGEGPLQETCRQLVAQSRFRERIRLVGAVNVVEAERLRRNADIFTAHSQKGPESRQQEAYGVAFVEAMMMGLPVVTGRSGFLPHLITSGVHGLLFEPGDVEAHAWALLELSRNGNLREELGRNAAERARSQYTAEMECTRLKKIYGLA